MIEPDAHEPQDPARDRNPSDGPVMDTAVPVAERLVAGIERTTRQIASGGTMWTGSQRVAIASVARSAAAGESGGDGSVLPAPARTTAAKVATDAHLMAQADVDTFDDPAAYVEIVGVVARTIAIDTFARGVDADPIAFPIATDDPPSGQINPHARQRSSLVPTAGGAGPTTALSLVPAEDQAQEDLHGTLYLTYLEMGDPTIHKGLSRWQLELVAARTSLINHCRF